MSTMRRTASGLYVQHRTPVKMYFASAGSPAFTPTADSRWNVATSPIQRPLLLLSELSTGSNADDTQHNEATTTNPIDRLKRQHVSNTQVATAHTISGQFRLAIQGQESSVNLNGWLQCVITLWDSTGVTRRGALFAGQTMTSESATAGDPNQEFDTTNSARLLVQQLTPLAASVGDRIVVELGFRSNNTVGTSMGVTFRINDSAGAANGDQPATPGDTTLSCRPWIEFSDNPFR